MILNKDVRNAFNNEDWEIVKEYIEFLENLKDMTDTALAKLEKDGQEETLTKYFSEFKQK